MTTWPGTAESRLRRRPWRPLVSVSVTAGALLIALGASAGPYATAAAVAVAMAGVSFGWVRLLDLPSPRGTRIVLTISSLLLLGTGLLPDGAGMAWLPLATAFSVFATFGHQLGRRDGRPRLVESVSGTLTGVAVLASGASLVPLSFTSGGQQAVVVTMAGVAAAALADLVLLVVRSTALAAGIVAALLGGITAAIVSALWRPDDPTWASAALVGAVAAWAGYALRAVQSVLPHLFGRGAQIASGMSSCLAVGILAHLMAVLGTPL